VFNLGNIEERDVYCKAAMCRLSAAYVRAHTSAETTTDGGGPGAQPPEKIGNKPMSPGGSYRASR
jgi:hypothetical protein